MADQMRKRERLKKQLLQVWKQARSLEVRCRNHAGHLKQLLLLYIELRSASYLHLRCVCL